MSSQWYLKKSQLKPPPNDVDDDGDDDDVDYDNDENNGLYGYYTSCLLKRL